MSSIIDRIDNAMMRTDRVYNPNAFWWAMACVFLAIAIMGVL